MPIPFQPITDPDDSKKSDSSEIPNVSLGVPYLAAGRDSRFDFSNQDGP